MKYHINNPNNEDLLMKRIQDTETSIRMFYQTLWPHKRPEESIEIRCFSESRRYLAPRHMVANEEEFVEKVLRLSSEDKFNIFAGVSYRDSRSKSDRKGDKDHCSGASVLWADIDVGNGNHKKECYYPDIEDAMEDLAIFEYRPDLIVDSGGGLHVYWKLEHRAEFPEEIEKIEYLNAHIAERLHGDSVKDVTRIMRVPGTRNHKYEDRTICRIIDCELTPKENDNND